MDFRPSHEGGDKRSITLPLFHFQIPQMQQTPVSEPQAAQQFNLIKLLLPVATETLNFASASAALARLGSAFPSRNFTRDYWLTLSYLGVSCSILITFSLNLSLQHGWTVFRHRLQATLGPWFHCVEVAADTSHRSLQPSLPV